MVRDIGVHRPYDAEIVDTLPDIREDFTDLDTALAELAELEWRRERGAGAALRLQRDWYRLSCEFGERGLRIEGIHMRCAAVHEQVQDAFGFGRQRRRLGSERIHSSAELRRLKPAAAMQSRTQGHHAHSHAAARQHFASREQ